ncbi:MAG: PPOX class F420-dependent oxidoreductase [Anaerolineae bacterium]|nr:PPOX class F420-dependent oxidoreductase [Anaerolineae bacterium]
MPAIIPDSHRDLLTEPIHAVLTTLMPDGQPQCTVVWLDYDGAYLLVNTTLERRKGRNMQRNPAVAVLVVDPANGSRWIEIRGRVVEITPEGAEAHADRLTRLYTGRASFYGDIYPVERRLTETRVIVKIEPVKVAVDAVFK